MHRPIILFLALMASSALAGPYIPAGDLALRHDIQRLADYGIITGPISTWPLAWGPILNDIRNADATRASVERSIDAAVRICPNDIVGSNCITTPKRTLHNIIP